MELRDFAERVLRADRLADKLAAPGQPLTDEHPGTPLRCARPGRPADLGFSLGRSGRRMPRPDGFREARLRAAAHHIMANHELQALEIMAWTVLAFPDAPAGFRMGMAEVMRDEQMHTRVHANRCAELGTPFGSLPVNGYLWLKAMNFTGVMDYLAGVPLTFEGANLDHTVQFAGHFRRAGDEKGARIMETIHRDEIGHVAFGIDWLRRLKPAGADDWQAYVDHLHWPMCPKLARGAPFQRAARQTAGLDDDFIVRLEEPSP